MNRIIGKSFDEERALHHSNDLMLENVKFTGPQDGESALKVSINIMAANCLFDLRYPLWHCKNVVINNCEFTDKSRASIWYSENVKISESKINSVKVFREVRDAYITDCDVTSAEPFWYCDNINIEGGDLNGEYAFLNSRNIKLDNVNFSGKYSFQYVNNLEINNCYLNTKDAFWGSKNIVVRNSVIKGEYLAWYSENLHLIDCKIIGTQPLCYCKDLVLENCEMIDSGLAFEYSDVKATIINTIDSIKNPKSGYIKAKGVKEIIQDEFSYNDSKCEIIIE